MVFLHCFVRQALHLPLPQELEELSGNYPSLALILEDFLQLRVECNVRFLLKRSDTSEELVMRRNGSQERWPSEQFKGYITSLSDLVDISNPPNRDAIIELLRTRSQSVGNSSAALSRSWLSEGYHLFAHESLRENLVIDTVIILAASSDELPAEPSDLLACSAWEDAKTMLSSPFVMQIW